ncbi:mitochondrial fission 1 protein-like isoform X1 [Xenia sp. Carnegie-2017]|uniref:mitochondrial fission 1 protein-like isoform X1 n=1 Tax=Xenia sp. Carnegie-2017 TaxID=2897299 RepID=UPI001F04957B|nr:mitochondrial fission 1 protein-like isoform X1 [Xenia sp. Carnegie-2017]
METPDCSTEDLKVFEEKYTQEFISGKVSKDTQFNYAWSLTRRQNPADIRKGAQLLQDLCKYGTDQRDYLYFLAEANYKLSEYPVALKYINRVLNIEPNNTQAKALKEKIEQKMKRDGILGAAIAGAGMVLVGGTVLVVAGAAALVGVFSRKK